MSLKSWLSLPTLLVAWALSLNPAIVQAQDWTKQELDKVTIWNMNWVVSWDAIRENNMLEKALCTYWCKWYEVQLKEDNKKAEKEQKKLNSTTKEINNRDLIFQLSKEWWNISVVDWEHKYSAWVEFSGKFWVLTSLEYWYFDWTLWTLATTKIWTQKKSFLITWFYKWIDFWVKTSVWGLLQKVEWKKVGQIYAWLEVIADLSNILEWLSTNAYVNWTVTQNKTLSIKEVTNKVEWWTEITTTTKKFIWDNSFSWWLAINYQDSVNIFHANAGLTNLRWFWYDYWVWYEHKWDLIKAWIDYSWKRTPKYTSDIYSAYVSWIIYPEIEVWIKWESINSTTSWINWLDNSFNDAMVNSSISYVPWLTTYKPNWELDFTHLFQRSHVTWANEAMNVLHGHREAEVKRIFIPDQIDRKDLDSAIDEASKIDRNKYTKESLEVLDKALILSEKNQKEINIKTWAIREAIKNLKEKILLNTSALNTINGEIALLTPVNYSNWDLIIMAQGLPQTTQTEVNAKVVALTNARNSLTLIALNTDPTISWITSTWHIEDWENIKNIWLTIMDDDSSQVTWTLSYVHLWDTWNFSQTTWTWNTLSWITFTPVNWWQTWRTIKATIVDSWSWNIQTVTIYQN